MKPFNFEVKEKPGEPTDRLIKRFLKKTSKSNLVQFCLEQMSFVSKSTARRKKKSRKAFVKRKIQNEYQKSLGDNSSEK
jgi:hypothetical protein